jgi:chromate transporter
VVGVILNLAVWFSMQVMFTEVTRLSSGLFQRWVPDLATFDCRVPVLALLAGLLLLRLHQGVPLSLAVCAVAGLFL